MTASAIQPFCVKSRIVTMHRNVASETNPASFAARHMIVHTSRSVISILCLLYLGQIGDTLPIEGIFATRETHQRSDLPVAKPSGFHAPDVVERFLGNGRDADLCARFSGRAFCLNRGGHLLSAMILPRSLLHEIEHDFPAKLKICPLCFSRR